MSVRDVPTTTTGRRARTDIPAPDDHPSAASPWLHAALWLSVAALSLWLRLAFPLQVIPTSIHDDALFLRLARFLVAGRWLGGYDNLTLAKGMFYPLFIGVATLALIPLKFAEHVAYLAASWLVARLVGHRAGRPALGFLLFLLLAFNPVLWDGQLARVIREGIYITQSLGLVGMVAALAFPPPGVTPRARVTLGILTGLLGASFWLTREEGVWLLPSLFLLLALGALHARFGRAEDEPADTVRRRLTIIGVPVLVAAGTFILLNLAVMSANQARYGAFVTVEFRAHAFQRAYGALARIEHDERRPYVVFPHDARLRAYSVSAAARELEPAFEGQLGDAWRRVGCEQTGSPDAACPEILSGWFMWALRDAAKLAGHARSGRAALAFYERLADEVDAGCDTGRIRCGPARATLAPVFEARSIPATLDAARRLVPVMLGLGAGAPDPIRSLGSQFDVLRVADAIGPAAPVQGDVVRLWGWVRGDGSAELWLRPAPGAAPGTELIAATRYMPDPNPDQRRFILDAICPPGTCELVVRGADGAILSRPLESLRPGTLEVEGVTVLLDGISPQALDEASQVRRRVQLPVARAITRAAQFAMPLFFALGTLGLLVAAVRRFRPAGSFPVWALAVASLGAVVARTLLLAYLEATSIPSVNVLYASPAMPFVILVAVLGTWLGVAAIRAGRRDHAAGGPG